MHDVCLLQEPLLRHKVFLLLLLLQLPLDTHVFVTMSPYRGFKSFVVFLAVLVACTDAKGVVLPTIDNYTDESAIVRDPSFESEAAPGELPENMMAPPAMVYYLEMTRNRIRQPNDLFRKGLQPKSYLATRPVAALMGEVSDGRNNKRSRRQGGFSLARGVSRVYRRAAEALVPGIDYENPADQTDYLRKGDVDCADDLRRRLDPRCRSLQANPDEEDFEQKEKRREFVVDLGKRFDDFRADLGKRLLNDGQNFH